MTTKKASTVSEGRDSTLDSDQLMGDFKALMADAEALIKVTASHDDGVIGSVRSKALETLTSAKENFDQAQGAFTEKANILASDADDFVHRNPWEAVGVAAGLGLLLGLLMRRR